MSVQLTNLFLSASFYAQLISIPVFTLLTLVWAFRHQQWVPNENMRWYERGVTKLITFVLAIAPTASMLVGDWLLAGLLCLPLVYITWIGATNRRPLSFALVLLAVTAALGVISWAWPNAIVSLLLILVLVGIWELWFRFLDAVQTVNIGWFATFMTTFAYFASKKRVLDQNQAEQFASLEVRRQSLIPRILRESVQLLPAMFMVAFLIRNLF